MEIHGPWPIRSSTDSMPVSSEAKTSKCTISFTSEPSLGDCSMMVGAELSTNTSQSMVVLCPAASMEVKVMSNTPSAWSVLLKVHS